jgi:O-antigen/teichoic acid export membrane protein
VAGIPSYPGVLRSHKAYFSRYREKGGFQHGLLMLRNILSNWASLAFLGLLSFLLTPFMIHHLGDLDYGIFVLAFSMASYWELLDVGIRSTLQRFIGRMRGLGDRQGLNATFSTALALTIGIGALVVMVAAVLSELMPGFFRLHGWEANRFRWLVVLLGLNTGFGLPAFLFNAYLGGLERFDLLNAVQVGRQVLRAVLIIVVLLLGYGVLAVGGVTLVSQLVLLPINWRLIRWVDPGLQISWSRVSRGHARELLGFSFWTLFNNAGQVLRDGTDSIVIGRVLGAAFITPFSVASRLIDYFRPMIIAITGPLMPRVSRLQGSGRSEEVKTVYLRLTRLTALVSLLVGSILLLDGRLLLRLWVGAKYVSSYGLLVWLTVGAVVSLAQYGTLQLLMGLGRHRAYGLWTLLEGLANLGLSIVWAHWYGLVGVALGTAVPLLVVKLTLQPWYTMRVLGMPLREYFSKALARPVVTCGIFFGVAMWAGGIAAQGTLFDFLLRVAWQVSLFVFLTLLIGIEASDRKLVKDAVRQGLQSRAHSVPL